MDYKIPGVGAKTESYLEKLGIYTVDDLIYNYPRRYEKYPKVVEPSQAKYNEECALIGTIISAPSIKPKHVSIKVKIGTNEIWVSWFRAPFNLKDFKKGHRYVFVGKITKYNSRPQFSQPAVYELGVYEGMAGHYIPMYSLTKGLSDATMRKAINGALSIKLPTDFLNSKYLHEKKLMNLSDAIINIHHPQTEAALLDAQRRLKYNEFFLFMLDLTMSSKKGCPNMCPMTKRSKVSNIIDQLPYSLTTAQLKAWKDIESDVTSEYRMVRLVQGDVGCGKTIVSFLALFLAVENTYQGALMAPTEVLAAQHYEDMLDMIKKYNLPYKCALLSGTTKRKEELYNEIKDGSIDIIIGTHAIIQENLEYKKLGLVVTDEQHRFGVKQRDALAKKGEDPHILYISATPIPRSLGLVIYGDMNISIINELPANRLPNKNLVLRQTDYEKAWRFIKKEIDAGHQAYVICPMVEENENFDVEDVESYVKKMKDYFNADVSIDLLHGKMTPDEKNSVMENFSNGKTKILISTTVVEVGVNVPNATVMMIENAERFGLSQLHQLRGRVGRGSSQGYCIFMQGCDGECPRLNVISSTNDGFKIADEDMKMRGVGDLLGEKQSGSVTFKIGDIYSDSLLLKEATNDARELLKCDPDLSKHQEILEYLSSCHDVQVKEH